MKPRFELEGTYFVNDTDSVLVIQAGSDYLAYAVTDAPGTKLVELKWYPLKGTGFEDMVTAAPALHTQYAKTIIVFDFPAYALLPVDLNEGDNSALLHLAGADVQDHIIYEPVTKDIAVNYSVPFTLLNNCIRYFPGASYWHLQKVRVMKALTTGLPAVIDVNIIDNRFSVVVVAGGQLLLAQDYSYRTPEDLLFYLLKIVEVNKLSQTTVQLNITGLIEADSKLFRLLYDYFLDIHLDVAGWKEGTVAAYPDHYFTTLKQVAQCGLLQEH